MSLVELSALITLALVVIAFLSGIGITTIGPGGIFVTVALFTLTPLSSGEVAGTAHLTFIGTGIVGSVVYLISGEMNTGEGRAMVIILSLASIAGALLGAFVNQFVSRGTFGVLLGIATVAVGAVILYRERRGFMGVYSIDVHTRNGRVLLAGTGMGLGFLSGLLGVGGPVLAVPALVLLGVPMLLAVAVAQVQSIFIAAFATTGYLLQGSVSFVLAALVGIPLLLGVIVGWRVAHIVDPGRLKVALAIVLIAVGPYLAM